MRFTLPAALLSIAVVANTALLACGRAPNPDEKAEEQSNEEQQNQTPQPLTELTASASGLKATLLSADVLHVGLNKVQYRVVDEATNTSITDATVTHEPLMKMQSMSHGCPLVQPSAPASGSDLYAGEIVFTMASGSMGSWSVTLKVQRPGEASARAVVFDDVSVAETNLKKSLTVGSDTFIFTLNFDGKAKVGTNAFVLTAHKKGMSGFPAQTDLAIKVTPQMPEMGHGSSGNVNPTHVANGEYQGSVNLTMAGHWTIDFAASSGATSLGTVQFAVDL